MALLRPVRTRRGRRQFPVGVAVVAVVCVVVSVSLMSLGAVDGAAATTAASAAFTSTVATSRRTASTAPINTNAIDDKVPSWRRNRRDNQRLYALKHDTTVLDGDARNKRGCLHPCPEPDDDVGLDRREALFATLGTLWAVTTSGGTMTTAAAVSSATATAAWTWNPSTAHAARGADAKIELPNPIQGASDRANKQCLVESLGNRECLVYEDPANKLYQGLDSNVALVRIEPAMAALATIPSLVAEKKWSKITGAMTGPMGELIKTMVQLSASNENNGQAQRLVQTVKKDLYALQEAVSRKDGPSILKFHAAATSDMAAFVKALE